MNKTPIVSITRDSPQLQTVMQWGSQKPPGEILLRVRRVGDRADFAMYPPLQEKGSVLLFQFDELLFQQKQGRFQGRLFIGPEYFGEIQFEYSDTASLVTVEK